MMGIWGILLFCYQTHLASAVVVRLVQLQQLLTLEHVHDLNLSFHVSPDDHQGHQDGVGVVVVATVMLMLILLSQ